MAEEDSEYAEYGASDGIVEDKSGNVKSLESIVEDNPSEIPLAPQFPEEKGESSIEQKIEKHFKEKENKKKVPLTTIALAIVIIAFAFFALVKVINGNSELEACYDGTVEGSCSSNKPFYCYKAKLVKYAEKCGCPSGFEKKGNECIKVKLCEDGTKSGECSSNKPYFCEQGFLIVKASVCGCKRGEIPANEFCVFSANCSDGTFAGECSLQKPFYCINESLIEKASVCGCSEGMIEDDDSCLKKYQTGTKLNRTYSFVVKGETGSISMVVYKSLKDYLAKLPRTFVCNDTCPSREELEMKYINEKEQKEYLSELLSLIKTKTNDSDERVRIAVALVQNIPYDYAEAEGAIKDRFPYEVLYDNAGVCGEKSRLLAYILREFGYGTVLFHYESQKHMAVGIKCPVQYSYKSSGYCFIETTRPLMMTDYWESYAGIGKLTTSPNILNVSSGKLFDGISEEYNDGQEWYQIENMGRTLDGYHYDRYKALVAKYGLETT